MKINDEEKVMLLIAIQDQVSGVEARIAQEQYPLNKLIADKCLKPWVKLHEKLSQKENKE